MAVNGEEKNNYIIIDHKKEEEDDDVSAQFASAVNLCFSQIQFAVLNAACEMKVFVIIASANGRHVSSSEVASHLPSSSQHEDLVLRLDRMLRLLANHELLTCSYGEDERERLYGISPIGKLFVGTWYLSLWIRGK